MNSILTVSEISTYISFKLKNDPKLKGIAISGEISDVSVSTAGHFYFSLSDGKCMIKSVMFASAASRLKFFPETGQKVIAFGGIDVYEKSGVYQLNCTQLVPSGIGADRIRLMQLKEELDKLGIFSAQKKPITKYPNKLAVVTSPNGAAIEDVRAVAKRRYPCVYIELFEAVVQGVYAPSSIADALYKADRCGADTIILTRGGGSNDDLSCFNTKEAVMAVYNCSTPVVSAVGHEIDVTLCDLAADLRAPTPSGAAELCTPDINQIGQEISGYIKNMKMSVQKKIFSAEAGIDSCRQLINAYSPSRKVSKLESTVYEYKENIKGMASKRIIRLEDDIRKYAQILSGFNPMKTISRGYSLVYKQNTLVKSSLDVCPGDDIKIITRDSTITADVKSIEFGDKT